ncbi:uncharacterized protein ACIBXB_006142 [Morphnus guianensis]
MHVSIDTFSSVVIATAHTGEAARDVIRHWQRAFSVAGVPQQIKTDNGPAYLSTKVTDGVQQPPMLRHFGSLTSISGVTPGVKVQIRDLQMGQWSAPCDLLTWGRGYACVSTDTGPRWVPARLVKPYLEVSSPAAVSSE